MRIKDNGQGVVCAFNPAPKKIVTRKVAVRIKRSHAVEPAQVVGLASEVCRQQGRPVSWLGAFAFPWGWV